MQHDPVQFGDGPLVAASDGTAAALPALRLTRMLAARLSCGVEVITVLEPLPVPPEAPLLFSVRPDLESQRRDALLNAVRGQVREVFGDSGPSVVMQEGDAAVAVARFAEDRHARALIMGLSRHGAVDRLLGGETPVEVLRLTEIPVLAVEKGSAGNPALAIVAIDFSEESVHAARIARAMFGNGVVLVLAHVIPAEIGMAAGSPYQQGSEAAFAGVREALGITDDSRSECVVLHGSPAHELLALARSRGADLIVAGRERSAGVRRFVAGSVATRLLRGADCSVLVVPAASD